MLYGCSTVCISLIKKQVPLTNENRKKTLIAGIFLGIHFALFFSAIKLTTIANATFLGTLAPLFTFCNPDNPIC